MSVRRAPSPDAGAPNAEPSPSGEAGSANGSGNTTLLRSSCFAVTPGTIYNFGVASRAIGQGINPDCGVRLRGYSGDSCVGSGNLMSSQASFPSPLPTIWTRAMLTIVVPAGVGSARVQLDCASNPAIVALFDDVFFGEGPVPVELQSLSVE